MLKTQNITLRKTAQVFHSLGFFWARETGMFDLEFERDSGAPPLDPSATEDVIEEEWRTWAAKETQLRALLGENTSLARESAIVGTTFSVANRTST
jgi:hypothetical protein